MKLRSGRHRYLDTKQYLVLQVEFYEWTGTRWNYSWEFATAADMPYSIIVDSTI